jgi:predicted dehydrogenase
MIDIGVVGAGHWGPNLIRSFQDLPGGRVVWVIDHDRRRLDEVQGRYPGVRVGDDPVAALPDVDALVVATPATSHFALAHLALSAGKDVLIEKPMTMDIGDAEELCRLARSSGNVLMVSHLFLYARAVQWVRDYLWAGQLGSVYHLTMVRNNLGPIRDDANAAWDLAAHDVSIANYWLKAAPIAVSAVGGKWINPCVEDAVFVTMRYPDDVLVNLHASWLSPRKVRDITVVGSQRMLTLDDMNLTEPVRVYDKRVLDGAERSSGVVDTFASFRASIREGDISIPRITLEEPLKTECMHFLECVVKRTEPITSGRQGTSVVRVLEAIDRSLQDEGREAVLEVERVDSPAG